MRAYHLFADWIFEARPKYDLELFDIYVPIKPIGKERPRGAEHRTPIKTRTWEDYVGSVTAYDLMEDRPPIDFPVTARIIFGLHKNRADTDNLEKILWDALQRGDKSGKGRAILDDRFVRGYIEKCEKEMPKGEEFIWVRFYAQNQADYDRYTQGAKDVIRDSDGY